MLLANTVFNHKDFNFSGLIAKAIDDVSEKQMEIILVIHKANSEEYINLNARLLVKEADIRSLIKDRNSIHKNFPASERVERDKVLKMAGEQILQFNKDTQVMRDSIAKIKMPFSCETYRLTMAQFQASIQDLCNKRLLVDLAS